MKTTLFLILCLMSTTLMQLSAQNSQKDDINKSIVTRGLDETFVFPVFCDGVQVDELICSPPSLYVNHYQKGVRIWSNSMSIGEATSLETGEVFRLKDFDKITVSDDPEIQGLVVEHMNLVGNKGSHYIFTCTYEFPAWKLTSVVKASCPGTKF
jgi:hypothetical protein